MNGLIMRICASAGAFVLTSCSSWPQEGEGGFAEYQYEHLLSVENPHPLSTQHGLRFDYTLLKNQLSLLTLQGAYYCFPASVKKANQLEKRIIRELSGGMYDSASTNIVSQRIALTKLELKLNHVLRSQQCSPPTQADSFSQYKHILTLLNTDNQFAINSAEVNPKYNMNLLLAIEYLREHIDITILIVGNTDSYGDEQSNMVLSKARASAVKSLLVDGGVETTRIVILPAGEYTPIYPGKTKAVNLVNRNVSIYLLGVY